MKITILAIGKKHDPKITDSIAHYEKMLGGDIPEWILLESKSGVTDNTEQTKRAEATLLLQRLKPDDTVIVLDEHATQLSSPEFAKKLQKYQLQSTRRLVFVIGGAFGLDQVVIDRADFTWSLSKLVFPHQLVRLLLMEQIYRATTINHGKSYHY